MSFYIAKEHPKSYRQNLKKLKYNMIREYKKYKTMNKLFKLLISKQFHSFREKFHNS